MVVFIYISPFVVALGMPLIARSERLRAAAERRPGASPSPASPGPSPKASRGRRPARCSGSATASASSPACSGARRRWRSGRRSLEPGVGREDAALPARRLGAAAASSPRCSSGAPLPHRLSSLAWGSLAFQTVIVSFASYLVWFWLVRHYPATRLASFTMLTPVFGLVLGARAARRAGDRAPADRARDRRRRHLPRQPQDAVTRHRSPRSRCAWPSAPASRGRSGAGSGWRHGADAGALRHPPGPAAARPRGRAARRHEAGAARDVEGRHYAFRGRRVQVLEDADRRRWVRLADVRADRRLHRQRRRARDHLPRRRASPRPAGRASRRARRRCSRTCCKERAPEAARLRVWVEREIVFPARRERERLGIRLPAAGTDARATDAHRFAAWIRRSSARRLSRGCAPPATSSSSRRRTAAPARRRPSCAPARSRRATRRRSRRP